MRAEFVETAFKFTQKEKDKSPGVGKTRDGQIPVTVTICKASDGRIRDTSRRDGNVMATLQFDLYLYVEFAVDFERDFLRGNLVGVVSVVCPRFVTLAVKP